MSTHGDALKESLLKRAEAWLDKAEDWAALAEMVNGDDRKARHLRGVYLARARSCRKQAKALQERAARVGKQWRGKGRPEDSNGALTTEGN